MNPPNCCHPRHLPSYCPCWNQNKVSFICHKWIPQTVVVHAISRVTVHAEIRTNASHKWIPQTVVIHAISRVTVHAEIKTKSASFAINESPKLLSSTPSPELLSMLKSKQTQAINESPKLLSSTPSPELLSMLKSKQSQLHLKVLCMNVYTKKCACIVKCLITNQWQILSSTCTYMSSLPL